MKLSTALSFLTLVLPIASASSYSSRRRHHEVANRVRADVDVHKRSFTNVRFTYYDVGLGACGIWNKPSDLIVALNVEQFGPGYPGQYCFQTVVLSYNGKVVRAMITDKCMGCAWGALDLSRGLFDIFAEEELGVLHGEWWFEDE